MLDDFKNQWNSMSESQQTLSMIAAAILFILIIVFVIIIPQTQHTTKLQTKLDREQQNLIWMQRSADKIKAAGPTTIKSEAANDTRSLASRVSAILSVHKIKNAQIKSKNNNQVSISLQNTDFNMFHKALFTLENNWKIKVDNLQIERLNSKPGQVSIKTNLRR